MGDKGAVLATRVTNNPGVGLRGGEIFVANIGDDRAELLYRAATIFGCWLLSLRFMATMIGKGRRVYQAMTPQTAKVEKSGEFQYPPQLGQATYAAI